MSPPARLSEPEPEVFSRLSDVACLLWAGVTRMAYHGDDLDIWTLIIDSLGME